MVNIYLTKEAKTYSKDGVVNKWCWENWTGTRKKVKLHQQFTSQIIINSKQIKGLNVKSQNHKTPRRKHRHSNLISLAALFSLIQLLGEGKQIKQMTLHQTQKLFKSKRNKKMKNGPTV